MKKKQSKGLSKIQPNENMSNSYLSMAKESIVALDNMKQSRIWTATASYYVFYYSLYSFMLRLGFKCEIHSCSIKFMEIFLMDFYDISDINTLKLAFGARIDLQYYANRPVDDEVINKIKLYCKDFYVKTKDILSILTENQIEDVRQKYDVWN